MSVHTLQNYKGRRYFATTTPLNRKLDAAYQRCLDRGGHVASGDTIQRDFSSRQLVLPICRVCTCPYNFPKITSARARWNGVTG